MKTMQFLKAKAKNLLVLSMLMSGQFMMALDPTSKITEWGKKVQTGLDAAVGVFAVVGGFLIFIQYMQGNEQAQKNFIKYVIGLAIFGMCSLIGKVFITP